MRQITPDEKTALETMWKAGRTINDIRTDLSIGVRTLAAWRTELGLQDRVTPSVKKKRPSGLTYNVGSYWTGLPNADAKFAQAMAGRRFESTPRKAVHARMARVSYTADMWRSTAADL